MKEKCKRPLGRTDGRERAWLFEREVEENMGQRGPGCVFRKGAMRIDQVSCPHSDRVCLKPSEGKKNRKRKEEMRERFIKENYTPPGLPSGSLASALLRPKEADG